MKKRTIKEDLAQVFGGNMTPVGTNTAVVLNTPSGLTKEQAMILVTQTPMGPVLRDLGAVVARELGNELLAHGMRPADFALLPDLPKVVTDRIMKELSEYPEEFSRALIQYLSMKG